MLAILRKFKRDIRYEVHDVFRMITQRHRLNTVVNHKEIRIVGLRRTGNHAIINWIRKQHCGEVWHLNSVRAGENPYRYLYSHYPRESLRNEALGNFVTKDCLLYNYEDHDLDLVVNSKFEKKHDLYIGKSSTRYDLIILRDPFNLMASRIKNNYLNVRNPNGNPTQLWIEYAREFLGETNYLQNNKICCNYNRWFSDIEYRKEFASKLGLEFTDRGINQVKTEGGGSSFDGEKFDGKATQMDVINRYKLFQDNPIYQQLVNNEELREYSRKIFGNLDS